MENLFQIRNVWSFYRYGSKQITIEQVWQQVTETNCLCCTQQQLKDRITNLTATNVTGGTVYFSPASKYPRFKLANSSFKRCIKLEKADYYVYSPGPVYQSKVEY